MCMHLELGLHGLEPVAFHHQRRLELRYLLHLLSACMRLCPDRLHLDAFLLLDTTVVMSSHVGQVLVNSA
jgi:hypothetical protein